MNSSKENNTNTNDSLKEFPGRGGWRGIDINCDMGEGIGNDDLILPFISSANIACGYHAGDVAMMWQTVESAIKHTVAIGAHISFHDRNNFGRSEMQWNGEEVYDLVSQQLIILQEITSSLDTKIKHVKPHGALYNMSARYATLAKVIAKAVKDFDSQLILYGLSGSHSIREAKAIGLQTACEVFADRTYKDDGSLTPRSQPNALIEETDKVVAQVVQLIKNGTVTSITGKTFPVIAETICIHGDGKNAVTFARAIHTAITVL